MTTTAGSRYWAQRKRDAAIARRENRVADIKDKVAAGWSLTSVARAYGWSPRHLRRWLDSKAVDRHDLVIALTRFPDRPGVHR